MDGSKTLLSGLPADLWGHIGFYLPLIELVKAVLTGDSALSTRIRHGVRNVGSPWNRHGFAHVTRLLKSARLIPALTHLEISLEDYQRIEHPANWEMCPSSLRSLKLSFANCIESLCCLFDLDLILPNLEILNLTNAPVPTPLTRTFSLKRLPPRLWSLSLQSPHPSSRIDLTDTSIFPACMETLEIDYPPIVELKGALKFSLPILRTLRLNFGFSSCTFDINDLPSTLTSITLVPLGSLDDVNWTEKFPELSALVLLPEQSELDMEGHRILAHEDDEYQNWTDRHTLLVAPDARVPITSSMRHLRGLLIENVEQLPTMTHIQSLSVPGMWIGGVELPPTLKFFEASYIVMESLPSLPTGLETLKCSAILGIPSDALRNEFFAALDVVHTLECENSAGDRHARRLFPSSMTRLICTEYTLDKLVLEHLPTSIMELDAKFGWKAEFWHPLQLRSATLPNLGIIRDRSENRTSFPSLSVLPPSVSELNLRLDSSHWPFSSEAFPTVEHRLLRLTVPRGEIPHYLFSALPRSLLHLSVGTVVGNLDERTDPVNFGVKGLPQGLITLSIGSFELDDEERPEISEEAALALPKTLRMLRVESKLQRPVGLLRGIRLGTLVILIGNDLSVYTRRCQDSVPLEAGYTELFPSSIMYC